MIYSILGTSGFQVSRIGLGCSHLTAEKASLDLLSNAIDLGINFFDTADSYGQGDSERTLGRFLRTARDRVYVCTKIGYSTSTFSAALGKAKALLGKGGKPQHFHPAYLQKATESSLKRLQVESIDLLMLHSPPVEAAESAEVLNCLESLRSRGYVKALGVSCRSLQDAARLIALNRFDAIECEINLLSTNLVRRYLNDLGSSGTGVVARQPFASGKLFQHRKELEPFCTPPVRTLEQMMIQYVLSQPGVSTVLVGTRNLSHLRENVAALDQPSLTDIEWTQVEKAMNGASE